MGAYDDLIPKAGQAGADSSVWRVSPTVQRERDEAALQIKLSELADDPTNPALQKDVANTAKTLGVPVPPIPSPAQPTGNPYADLIPAKEEPVQIGRAGFQEQIKRSLGLNTRSLVEGGLSPASTVLGGLYGIYNVGADATDALLGREKGFRFKDPAQQLSQTLTQAGLPTPESGLEKVADFGQQMVAGAAALPIPAGKAPTPAPKLTVKDATTQKVLDAGYVVPPSLSGGNLGTNILESVGGKAAVKQQAAIRNQEITNELARKAAGLGKDEEITEAALKAARDRMSEPYRQIEAISPIAANALERLKQARADSKLYWKAYGRSADPEHLKQAQRFDQASEMLENAIEKIAARAGKPQLAQELKAARIALARNFDVDRALNEKTGDVSARVIGKLSESKPMGGDLETVASFARAFPQVSTDAAKTGAPAVSHGDAILATVLGMVGGTTFGPVGTAAALAPLTRYPARVAALSKWLQKKPSTLNPEELAMRARVRAVLGLDAGSEISE